MVMVMMIMMMVMMVLVMIEMVMLMLRYHLTCLRLLVETAALIDRLSPEKAVHQHIRDTYTSKIVKSFWLKYCPGEFRIEVTKF